MLTFLGENDRRAVGQILADLPQAVHLLLFITPFDDDYGYLVYDLLLGLVSLDTRLHLEVHNTPTDFILALQLGLSGFPAILVSNAAGDTANIRFYGLPSGYIFTTLLEAILQVGGATAISLRTETRAFLACLSNPIHIQIFVTADDEHCPATVVLAHAFAYVSPALVVDTIEVRAFPELIEQHGVTQTPTVVIDKQVVFSGAVTEAELLWQLRRVATSCY